MKHIRKFKESVDNDELQEFCNNNLAYLIDDGFIVSCTDRGFYSRVGIHKPHKTFNWYDVSNDIIPFMEVLSKDYIVSGIYFYINPRDKTIKLYDILNDNLDNYEIYGGITFNVTDK